MSAEPHIIINGVRLTDAQAMAVRVAVANLRSDLADPEARETWECIAGAYDARLSEVEDIMIGNASPSADTIPDALEWSAQSLRHCTGPVTGPALASMLANVARALRGGGA